MRSIAIWFIAASALGTLAACSGTATKNASSSPDAGSDGDDYADAASDASPTNEGGDDARPTYPAIHPDAPQIVSGGVIDAQPKIVTVSFANDPLEADLDTFTTAIGTSTYWGDRTKEYGIAAITPVGRIHDPTVWPATVDDAQIESWLIGMLEGDAGWPAPDENTVYALFLPPGVSVTNQAQGLGPSCGSFLNPTWHGYHDNVTLPDGRLVPYVMLPRCDSIREDPQATGILEVSAVVSHEIIEAITDPFFVAGQNGYTGTDPDHEAFDFIAGPELGDMCLTIGDLFYTPPDFPFLVQRIWSNSAALAGQDPCQPEPAGQVYFNSAPVLTDKITVPSVFGGVVATKGVKIPVGQSKAVEVDLFSVAPTSGPWTVDAVENDGTRSLHFAWDRSSGQNGDKLHLTITVASGNAGSESFVVVSSLGTQKYDWAGFVSN